MYKLAKGSCCQVVSSLAKFLCEYCMKNSMHYLVLGMSGGLDSAVVGGLAEKACELAKSKNYALYTVAVIMPCESDPLDEQLALKVIEKFNLKMIKIDLTDDFHRLTTVSAYDEGFISKLNFKIENLLIKDGEHDREAWHQSSIIAQGNVKARLRMIALRHIAKMLKGGMVLSTDNLSEYWMGFWTICGDVGDFAPIQKIMKGLELYEIARYLGVPSEIINRIPTDGLGVNKGGDAAQIGAEYPVVDAIMIRLIHEGFDITSNSENEWLLTKVQAIPEADIETKFKVAIRANNSAFKRNGTVIVEREDIGLPPIEKINLD